MAIYCTQLRLFPDAPVEVKEFPTLKEAHTYAIHKKISLRHEYYTIYITFGVDGNELEIHTGTIWRGLQK